MAAETEDDYMLAVTQMRDLVETVNRPNAMVFVADRKIAPMNVIKRVFPAAYNLLCICHISKNVLPYLINQFAISEVWEDFMGDWYSLCNTVTQPDFEYK